MELVVAERPRAERRQRRDERQRSDPPVQPAALAEAAVTSIVADDEKLPDDQARENPGEQFEPRVRKPKAGAEQEEQKAIVDREDHHRATGHFMPKRRERSAQFVGA